MNNKKLIAVFATGIYSRVQSSLYTKIYEEAQKQGYNLVFFSGSYDKIDINRTASVTSTLFSLSENMPFEAFIIHAQSIGEYSIINEVIETGIKKNIPIFVYDCDIEKLNHIDQIFILNQDYKQGFSNCVKHLIEHHNCRNIYMLAGMKDNKYSDDRIAMYKKEMESHNIPYSEEQIGYGDFWEKPAAAAVNNYLDSDNPTPDAICCANDSMAIAATKVLKARGFKIPEDIKVTGFDGIDEGKYNFPVISTSEPDYQKAAKFIFDVLANKNQDKTFMVPLLLHPKESCGCKYNDNLENREEIVRIIEGIRHDSWQNHMLNRMHAGLLDSTDLNDNRDYLQGALHLFEGYSNLLCIKNDIEYSDNLETPLQDMQVHMNRFLLPDGNYDFFSVNKIMPCFDEVMDNSSSDDFFVFRLVHSVNKIYGYDITRVNKYVVNELRLLDEFVDSVTTMFDSTLRNLFLKQATQKLSEMYDQISEIYIRDNLTGLFNRQGFYKCLNEFTERTDLLGNYFHLFSIDMDGMKYINDNFGHMEGDNAIKAVAKTLEDCFSQPCICARFGGDEFIVALISHSKEEPTAERVSKKINNYLKNLPILSGKKYTVYVSVGHSVIEFTKAIDLDSIIRSADDKMYIDKRSHKTSRKD